MSNPEPCENCGRAPQRVFLSEERLFVCYRCADESEEEPAGFVERLGETVRRIATPEGRTT